MLRAIENNLGKSDRAIAAIAGCDPKTVGSYRRGIGGEFPAISSADEDDAE